MTAKKLRVKLIRSLIGRTERQRACVRGLGLRKINSVSELENTPCVKGMINKVNFMVHVEEVS